MKESEEEIAEDTEEDESDEDGDATDPYRCVGAVKLVHFMTGYVRSVSFRTG